MRDISIFRRRGEGKRFPEEASSLLWTRIPCFLSHFAKRPCQKVKSDQGCECHSFHFGWYWRLLSIARFMFCEHNNWVKKNSGYIVASSIHYMYDVDKMQNSIPKIRWFHTPASHFHETDMTPWARLMSENWRRRTHSVFLVAVCPPSLAWHTTTDQTQYQGNCQYGQHIGSILYTRRWGFGWRLKFNWNMSSKRRLNKVWSEYIFKECVLMWMPTRCSTFLNESLRKQNKKHTQLWFRLSLWGKSFSYSSDLLCQFRLFLSRVSGLR